MLIFLKLIADTSCLDLPPLPEGTSIWRLGAILRVYCNNTPQEWQLNCINGEWVGNIGQCSITQGTRYWFLWWPRFQLSTHLYQIYQIIYHINWNLIKMPCSCVSANIIFSGQGQGGLWSTRKHKHGCHFGWCDLWDRVTTLLTGHTTQNGPLVHVFWSTTDFIVSGLRRFC